MKIGLPRALLYYKYSHLWEEFFKNLGCEIVISPESNKEILSLGIENSIDECCLPAKIYMGHVYKLIGKCDYILVPRYENFGRRDCVCVKFNAMYDIVKNTFKNVKLIDYNINSKDHNSEMKGFLKMGKKLNKSALQSLIAYEKARAAQRKYEKNRCITQKNELKDVGYKVLVVSHPYNIYDKMLGATVVEILKKLGVRPIFADIVDKKESVKEARKISKNLYWTFNKELIGAINIYKNDIDGIILLTAFPCGPDSLVNEKIVRKQKEKPTINIILDELQAEAGLYTRLESFVDIITKKVDTGVKYG